MHRPKVEIPVAILAGGLATRLRPLTHNIPKVLIEVAGKPFLEHQLIYLREQGISEVVLCVGHLGESVRDRFGDGSQYGIKLRYSFDGPHLLGTGGAIRRALPLLGDTFFILYGDSYLQIDFADVAKAFFASGRNALMTVFKNDNQWDVSNVEFAGGHIMAYDKQNRTSRMSHIDYGLSVVRSCVFALYPPDMPLDLANIMKDLTARGDLAGYEAVERFYEIGSHAGLAELKQVLCSRRVVSASQA